MKISNGVKQNKNITILAIETSCDDTGIAIIKANKNGSFKVLSNIVSSQIKIHKKWGGVYPMLAKREHQRNLLPVLIQALKQSKLLETQNTKRKTQNYNLKLKTLENILKREPELLKKILPFLKKYQKPVVDAIAVTAGPGLEPCLWVGVNSARALAYFWNLPIIPVNHIEAHILANFVGETQNSKLKTQNFPAVCLVVSGGHTQLILMEKIGKYEILGETRDDAAGECFDKTARILGLGYPGGPAIAKFASKKSRGPSSTFSVKLPRPMINSKNYDFSFSGLKTAVLYNFKSQPKKIQKDKNYIKSMCAEIQQSIIDILIKKTIKAAKDYNAKIPTMPTKSSILDKVGTKSSRIHDADYVEHSRQSRNRIGTIILGGGVAANEELRKQFQQRIQEEKLSFEFQVPSFKLCTDNALMTAIAGYFHRKEKTKNWRKIKADANLKIC